jgi:hypothetical protein
MKKLFSIFIVLSLILTSCSDWLDINEDPNNPTEMQINKILPGVYFDVAADFGLDYSTPGYVAAVYTHQLTTREHYDQYGILGSSYAVTTFWDDLYTGPLQDLEVLIELAEDEELQNTYYAGIAKVMKVYIYSLMVDLWGDIPFTEANEVDNFNPVFDDQKAIYTSLFALLEEAIGDLQNDEAENFNVPGSDDLIYGGNIAKWIKAAKSLQLVMYNKVQFTDLYDQSKVNALLDDELIGPNDNFMIPFGPSVAPDNRNPAFVTEYAGGQISNYISPWFYEILKGENDNIFSGIEDPRIPYYFAEQLDDDNPDTETNPEYKNGHFVSIYFGSVGSNRDGSGRRTFTMMGLYPVGGAYNNDATLDRSAALGISAGTGAAPFRIITYADILYIKAELAMNGKNPNGDPRELLEDAVAASFSLVDRVTSMAGADAPALAGTDEVDTYIQAVMAEYDNAGEEKKFEIIMTQKWISLFGTPLETYNDYRRTGYPVLFDPNTMGAIADGGPDGSGQVPVQSSRAYAVSFPYSADELSLNNNAPAQKTVSQDKVFWDN